MAGRVTLQDIADALGLSRRTVSNAINNSGVLSDATRERVLQKASEMGYRQFSYAAMLKSTESEGPPVQKRAIAILSAVSLLTNSHFSSTMLDKFQREVSLLGYSVNMHRPLPQELKERRLPATLDPENIAGLICFEVFDYNYAKMLCETGIPILFVDGPVTDLTPPLPTDLLLMENRNAIRTLIQELVRRGKKRIGFIGEEQHCQSFHERYLSYYETIRLLNLPFYPEYVIHDNMPGVENATAKEYRQHLASKLDTLEKLPDVFLCANDFVAFDVLQVLEAKEIKVPNDVYLCGFDDTMESSIWRPPLTTVHIHSQIMGYSAAQLLISRIREPTLNFRTVYTETTPVFRASCGQ